MGLSAPGVDSRGPLRKLSSAKQMDDPASVISAKSRKKMHTLPGGGAVRSVFVTACGNFGLAGSSTGHVVMWNMQSGIRRKTFDVGPVKARILSLFQWKRGRCQALEKKGSGRPVTGIAADPLNRVLVAATLDGTVNVRVFSCSK
jgi:hypothetical protein